MANELQVFVYGTEPVRTIEKNGEIWFVAKDICDILELTNPTEALKALENDEKNTLRISEGIQGRGNPNMNVINESGLYKLTFRSNKPEAKKFTKWVTSEILPALRKTGRYSTQSAKGSEKGNLEQTMKNCKQVYMAAGFRGMKLAVALDRVFEDYMGFSALAIAGIDPNEAAAECTPFWVRRILDYMKGHGNVTPNEIAQALGMKHCTAKVQLGRMVQQGYLRKVGFGVYALQDF